MKLRLIYAFIIFSFFFSFLSFAETTNKFTNNLKHRENNQLFNTNAYFYSEPTSKDKTPNLFFTLLKSFLFLAVFAIGLYYLFRFLMKKQSKGNINSDLIKVISQNTIGIGKYISIVKILNSYLIISISDNNINLIKEVKDTDEINTLKVLESNMIDMTGVSFEDYLHRFIGNFKLKTSKNKSVRNFEFLKKQKEKLNKLSGQNNEKE